VDILPDEEKRGVYREAGAWCKANGLYADALSYYEKSADYQAVTRIIGLQYANTAGYGALRAGNMRARAGHGQV